MSNVCLVGLLILFVLQVAANCFTPIWAVYTNMLGGDIRNTGIAILIFTWGTAFFAITSAILNKKLQIPDAYVLILGILFNLFAIVLYFFISSVTSFYGVQLLLAMGAGIQIPPFYLIYERNIITQSRSIAWGALDASLYFAIGFGSFIAAFLHYHKGIYTVFAFMLTLTILALVLAIIFTFLDKRNFPPKNPTHHPY
ncbi:MAG: hypothetical protein A3F11_06385 [Gammaproteobacteria bacterium RIFCSPHIGHO2_12_FULL_37_14]|nr:MAG: hypothetical protein A3F11_06385 [Gammaproteobacteria bacterium RIFCSPHIGHO2_12_FULL_37_14]